MKINLNQVLKLSSTQIYLKHKMLMLVSPISNNFSLKALKQNIHNAKSKVT